MTLTPTDFTAITGLGFDGDAVPLDSRYQTAALGAELVTTLLGVTTRTRYTSQGYVSYEVVYKFWAEQIRARLAAWRELLADVRPAAPAYTREERDQEARSFIFYIISSQLLCTSQNKGDPAVLACLQDLSLVGTYDWASLALAHLYHGLDELEIGRLRRHQTRQATAVSCLQMENDRLRTRLEVEGIPLDFSDEEEDNDHEASSDDAPPPPPSSVRQVAAGPSRRRP
ncbi:hypothetical protein JCGZ_17151 [Jatropha curcas]|uniref:Aminotransferase-like plant mobile domain-containing protein n=1 Tax=Jatropha curcas TaxID=180498 RepID=A0A067K254_JATCU|nr:hypothetical protein JCGZ_17151 [Jatropha curcas]